MRGEGFIGVLEVMKSKGLLMALGMNLGSYEKWVAFEIKTSGLVVGTWY